MRLLSFHDAHLKVDGVADDVNLGRLQVVEQVTVVPISIAHGIIVLRQTLVQILLVIHIALFHVEQTAQIVGSINGVAHPRDVAQVVFLTFIHLNIYVDVLVIHVPDAVFQNLEVAITILVVLLDKVFLVLIPAFWCVLLRL